jgi:SlyX protein
MENARLIDLEIRLTHQEATLQALNDVIADQQRLIDRLCKDMETLQRRMRDMSPSDIAAPWEETPPPHY